MAAPPIRKRITPQAVEQPTAVNSSFLDADLPLIVGPAPDQGDVRAVHPTLGAGRRIWVDIQDSWELKFKQVLRQQGLDINTWRVEQDEQYNTFHRLLGDDQGGKQRKDLLRSVTERVQCMYQAEDSDESGSEDDKEGSDDEGDGDEDEGGDEASSDDAEDAAAGDEIDLDKEAEAEATRKKTKQPRFERYEDDFIDDSELEKVKGGPKVKTVYSGFYINKGSVEVIEPVNKPRGRPPKPRAPGAAAAAAGAGKPPPAKRRKQQEPLRTQQQEQQQQEPQAVAKGRKRAKPADAGREQQQGDSSEQGAAVPKKKRSRSETPATAAADNTAAAPASKRAKKGSSAEPDSGPEAAPPPRPPPAVPQAAAGTSVGAATKSIGAAAVAAARAAAAKKAPVAAGAGQGNAPAAAVSPSGRSAGSADVPAAAAAEAQPASQQQPSQGALQQQTQHQPVPRRVTPVQVAAGDTAAAATAAPRDKSSAAAMAAAFPTSGPSTAAEAAEAGAAAAAELPGAPAAGLVVGGLQAAPGALPEQVMSAITALQEAVQQNEASISGPAATSASRTKVLGGPLLALGLAFARLPEQQQLQHTDQLVELVHNLLPHMSDRVLRRKLVTEPRDKLQALQDTRNTLLQALGAMRGAAGGGEGGGDGSSSDDGFERTWSQHAEDALLTAWTAAKAVGGQECLQQLAVDACSALGNTHVQEHPYQAIAELQPVLARTKKRQKAAKDESKAAAAAAAAAAEEEQQQQQQQQAAEAGVVPPSTGGVQAQAPHDHPLPSTAQGLAPAAPGQSSVPAAVAPAAAECVDVPAGPPEHQPCGSQDSDTATEGAAAEQGGAGGMPESQADAAVPAGGEAASQHTKEFSQWSAPSPRLQRCIDAAKAHGVSEEWLAQRYQSIRKNSPNIHQAFRALCLAGPGGCAVKDFKRVSDAEGLQLEDSKNIKQALRSKAMSSIAGTTEADPTKYALLAFPGVVMRPPPASKGGTPAASEAAAAAGAGSAAGAVE